MASVEVRKSRALRARSGPSKLQPARSMPLDYRYSAGASPANGAGGGPAANGGGRRAAAAEAENGGEVVVRLEGGDADSPYSSTAVTAAAEEEEVGERGGGGDEVDSAAAATPRRLSPRAAASPTEGDARWGDTSSYGAKKVGLSDAFEMSRVLGLGIQGIGKLFLVTYWQMRC
jgi:myosin V